MLHITTADDGTWKLSWQGTSHLPALFQGIGLYVPFLVGMVRWKCNTHIHDMRVIANTIKIPFQRKSFTSGCCYMRPSTIFRREAVKTSRQRGAQKTSYTPFSYIYIYMLSGNTTHSFFPERIWAVQTFLQALIHWNHFFVRHTIPAFWRTLPN